MQVSRNNLVVILALNDFVGVAHEEMEREISYQEMCAEEEAHWEEQESWGTGQDFDWVNPN